MDQKSTGPLKSPSTLVDARIRIYVEWKHVFLNGIAAQDSMSSVVQYVKGNPNVLKKFKLLHGMDATTKADNKVRLANRAKFQQGCQRFVCLLRNACSEELRQELDDFTEWADANAKEDPKAAWDALLNFVIKRDRKPSTHSELASEIEQLAQGNDSIPKYLTRVRRIEEAYELVGGTLDTIMMRLKFVQGLHPSYNDIKLNLTRQGLIKDKSCEEIANLIKDILIKQDEAQLKIVPVGTEEKHPKKFRNFPVGTEGKPFKKIKEFTEKVPINQQVDNILAAATEEPAHGGADWMRCFNCKKSGHFRSNCPEELHQLVQQKCNQFAKQAETIQGYSDLKQRFHGVQALGKNIEELIATIEGWRVDPNIDREFFVADLTKTVNFHTVSGFTGSHELNDSMFQLSLDSLVLKIVHIKARVAEEGFASIHEDAISLAADVKRLKNMIEMMEDDKKQAQSEMTRVSNQLQELVKQFKDEKEERRKERDEQEKQIQERRKERDEQEKQIRELQESMGVITKDIALGQAAIDAEAALLFKVGGVWAKGDYEWDEEQRMYYFAPSRTAKKLHEAFLARELEADEARIYIQFLREAYGFPKKVPARQLSSWFSQRIRSAKRCRSSQALRRLPQAELQAMIQGRPFVETWQAIIKSAQYAPREPENPQRFQMDDDNKM